jgi:hypothetical protein
MEPMRKENVERQDTEADALHRILKEISDDARALKNDYLDDTVVPEGGE